MSGVRSMAFTPGKSVVLVSAGTEIELRGLAGIWCTFVREHEEIEIDRVATATLSRPRLSERAVVLARNREEALAGLGALAEGRSWPGLVRGRARARKTVFVFPGQGAQWAGMAQVLWDAGGVFAESMQACADALSPYVEWCLREVLGDGGILQRVDVVQPALFSVMVSLARLWKACGVSPEMVVGHSQGEIAAAYVAGALSLEDAAKIVALRSRAIAEELAGKGGMVSIGLPVEKLRQRLVEFGGDVSVAAFNGPASTVVAGTPEALDALAMQCEVEGVWVRKIAVNYASHTAQARHLRERLLTELAGIRPRRAEVPFYSTLTGGVLDTAELDAGYWFESLASPVLFKQATAAH